MTTVDFTFEGITRQCGVDLLTADLALPFEAWRDEICDRYTNNLAGDIVESARGAMQADLNAVYIFGKMYSSGCKIGSSGLIASRQRALQANGNPDIEASALFWTVDAPFSLERMALTTSRNRGRRIHGEWTDYHPVDAARMIYEHAQERGTLFATSVMTIKNVLTLQRAQHQAQFDHLTEHWGKQRAAYWLSANPLPEAA